MFCKQPLPYVESMIANDIHRAVDKTARYVAEENIELTSNFPSQPMMKLAGRYFKRWDSKIGRFVSNIRDEYPDD